VTSEAMHMPGKDFGFAVGDHDRHGDPIEWPRKKILTEVPVYSDRSQTGAGIRA